jgi:hypothetical protein
LGVLAREQKVVEQSNISLADLTSIVLHCYLAKNPSICTGTDWSNPNLGPKQVEYAVLDVYASWAIYEALCLVKSGAPVTSDTLPGTFVKLLSRDRQAAVAYGFIAPGCPSKFQDVNVTKTRVIVNITLVKVPGYLIRPELLKSKEEHSLSSLGLPTPFGLLCQSRDLQRCVDDEYQHAHASALSGPLPPQPFIPSQVHDITVDEEPFSITGDTWVIGEAAQPGEQELQESQADPAANVRGQQLDKLHRLPLLDVKIRSRVLGDIYHLMAMFKISVHHGLRRPFARVLRDAIFIPDEEDKAMVSRVLKGKHVEFEEMAFR